MSNEATAQIPEKQAAAAEPAQPVVSTNAETDAFIKQRAEQKKTQRGGVKERIDALTRQAKEATEKAEAIIQTAKPAQPVAAQTVAAAVEEKPDPRPKQEDFKDAGEFTTAIASWVVRQQSKITAPVAAQPAAPAEAAPAEIKFNPADPVHVQLKTELDGFIQAGQEFIKRNPDFNDALNAAAQRGLTLDTQAQRAIIKLQAPEVAYFLAQPQNEPVARRLMALDGMSQVIEIGKLAERLQVKPTDFVSSAGNPGTRLTGGVSRATIPPSELDTDSYLQQRRNDIKAGLRRGR